MQTKTPRTDAAQLERELAAEQFGASKLMRENDRLRAELAAKERELELHNAKETCKVCNQQWNPSLIESGHCIFCIQKETKHNLTTLQQVAKELADRLKTIADYHKNTPMSEAIKSLLTTYDSTPKEVKGE